MPFGRGPRACPGKALALLELKIVLALVVREFDLAPAYAELEDAAAARGGEHGLHVTKGRLRTYRGERAYPTELGPMQPADGYPCRVTLNRMYAGISGGGSAERNISEGT
jgi:hypothetical protein